MSDDITIINAAQDGSDQSGVINDALANATTSIVMLPEGEYWIGSGIIVPEGKTLIGAGQGLTVVKVLAEFGPLPLGNGAVLLHDDSGLAHITIDVDKVNNGGAASQRIHGVVGRGESFLVEDVTVKNATGYAFFAAGGSGTFAGDDSIASGIFRDCYAENSNVLFEANVSNGVVFENCVGADGDGDIALEAAFHVLAGSSNILFLDCSYDGRSTAINITANTDFQSGIVFDNFYGRTTSPGLAAIVSGAGGNEVTIRNSTIVAEAGNAINVTNSTADSMLNAVASRFQSTRIAFALLSGSAVVTDTGAVAIAEEGFTGATFGAYSLGSLTWNGGYLHAEGGPGSNAMVGNVTTSNTIVGRDPLIAGTSAADQLTGTADADWVQGQGGDDLVRVEQGGNDRVLGGSGDDILVFGATLTAADVADGGGGADQLVLQGSYSGAKALLLAKTANVEQILLLSGNDTRYGDPGKSLYSYHLTAVNSNVAAGGQLQVDASLLRAGENFTFNGSAEKDGSFLLLGGRGNDNLSGGDGNDFFLFRGAGLWGAGDRADGRSGAGDQLVIGGHYAGASAIVFGANQIANIEQIVFMTGTDPRFAAPVADAAYEVTMNDANLAAGKKLVVDGSALAAAETLVFNGAAETNGSFDLTAGRGADTITGGALADTLRGGLGNDILRGDLGADTLAGNEDNDSFLYRSAAELTGDKVDGGAGSDRLVLDGAMSGGVNVAVGTLTGIESILLTSAAAGAYNAYNLTMRGNNVAAGQTMLVDGSALRFGESLYFDAINETAGAFDMRGGASRDYLFGGSGADSFRGGAGGDYLKGHGGADSFVYGAAADSTGTGFDQLVGFDWRVDKIDLPTSVSGWTGDVAGVLRAASFNADLAAAVDAALQPGSAVLFHAAGGDMNGRMFAVIDANGDGAYQAGQDYVFEFIAPADPIPPSTAFFI